MANSHYLEKARLANVMAAIQILPLADRPSGTLNRWIAELEASEELTSQQLDQVPIRLRRTQEWQRSLSNIRNSSRPTRCGATYGCCCAGAMPPR